MKGCVGTTPWGHFSSFSKDMVTLQEAEFNSRIPDWQDLGQQKAVALSEAEGEVAGFVASQMTSMAKKVVKA